MSNFNGSILAASHGIEVEARLAYTNFTGFAFQRFIAGLTVPAPNPPD